MKVFETSCKNCLLSPDRIVSPARMKEIVNGCVKNQSHFICHKASQEDENTCCRTFFDKLGQYSQMIRICERLGAIEFVPQPDAERLPSYNEMSPKAKRILKDLK
jgi:hypothetical protein